ncbi:MAG: hypothetical protein Tsb0034_16270 [Ekhidna sp.]
MKKIILIICAFSIGSIVHAHKGRDAGETRTATVVQPVNATDRIDIRAKNTDLVVESWNKNEVKVEATIRFDGKMTDKIARFLDEFEDHVKSGIMYSGGRLSIDTNLDEPNKFQIGGSKVGLIVIGFSEKELKLEYKISAPQKAIYDITHSYQDMQLIGDFDQMKISQYSGDLRGQKINKAEFSLKYGSAYFTQINTADMDIYEQEMEVGVLGTLELNTKYSEVEVEELGSMETTSYETDYIIGNADQITGNFKYGEIEITETLKDADLDCYEVDIEANVVEKMHFRQSKYSSIRAKRISKLTYEQSYEDDTEIRSVGTFKSLNSKYGNHKMNVLTGSIDLKGYEDDFVIGELDPAATSISIEGKYLTLRTDVGNASFSITGKVKYGKVNYDESVVNVKRYIKDNDELEIELTSKNTGTNKVLISVNGYEIDVNLD